MKRIILAALLALISTTLQAKDLQIAKGKRSTYSIYIGASPSQDVRQAAEELQKYITKSTGASLPIVSAEPKRGKNAIHILQSMDGKMGMFKYKALDSRTLNIDGVGRGVVYAVYDLLEQLGFRLYTEDAMVVPELATIEIGEGYERSWSPTITFRDTYYTPTRGKLYIDWHRQNHNTSGEKPDWGMWVHTYFRLVPPETYFASNPEYYALRGGKRVATQLCLSNFDVLALVTENLEKEIAANPKAKYWSVSPEDNFGYCECDECKAMNDQDGSPTGSVIQFADKIAEAFPDKVISTLAYQYSRAAPTMTLPRDNVNVMFCNIECNRSRPIADDPTSASFVKDMVDWAAITKNILVWDYIIQFKNLVSPFPNFHTLQPNIKFFVDHNVKGIFEQGNREVGGEFADLRSYVVSKLLIDPNASTDALIKDFCDGYYGDGGVFVKEYIDLITKKLIESGAELKIFGSPCDESAVNSWLSAENLNTYQAIFDQAEKAVAADPVMLRRVRIARQPLYYAELEQAKLDPYGARGMFIADLWSNWQTNPEFIKKLEMFIERCKDEGVTRLSEWHTTPDEYLEMMRSASTLHSEGVKSFQKRYTLGATHPRYSRGSEVNLTDGVLGTNDYTIQWIGWDAEQQAISIDLGSSQPISSVGGHFMQQLNDWIFYPAALKVLVSSDGHTFKEIATVKNELSREPKTGSKWIEATLPSSTEARYVKVIIDNIGTCPVWHLGAGGKAFVFMDELSIK